MAIPAERKSSRKSIGHLPKGGDWAEYAFSGVSSLEKSIVQRDDLFWSIGWHDEADGPFESRKLAEAVAAQGEGRHALAS